MFSLTQQSSFVRGTAQVSSSSGTSRRVSFSLFFLHESPLKCVNFIHGVACVSVSSPVDAETIDGEKNGRENVRNARGGYSTAHFSGLMRLYSFANTDGKLQIIAPIDENLKKPPNVVTAADPFLSLYYHTYHHQTKQSAPPPAVKFKCESSPRTKTRVHL